MLGRSTLRHDLAVTVPIAPASANSHSPCLQAVILHSHSLMPAIMFRTHCSVKKKSRPLMQSELARSAARDCRIAVSVRCSCSVDGSSQLSGRPRPLVACYPNDTRGQHSAHITTKVTGRPALPSLRLSRISKRHACKATVTKASYQS